MPEEDQLSGPPLLGLLLRLLDQCWFDDVGATLRAVGFGDIRPAYANVFAFVPPQGIRVGELAQLSHVRKQRMAQIVADLERLGYVRRVPDARDRRARLVVLTVRGRAVRPVGAAAGRRVEEDWARLTNPETIEILRSSLKRLLTELEGGDHPGC